MPELAAGPSPAPPRPPRRWRRLALGLVGVGGLLVLGLTAALPTLVGTRWGRDLILGRINAQVAPGRLAVDRFVVGWTTPTRLEGFRLDAPDGARVVDAPSATLDRSLASLLARPNAPTVLRIDRPALSIARRGDGTIDLVAALQGLVAHPDPTRDLAVRLADGSLDVRVAGRDQPAFRSSVALDLAIPPAPKPLTYDLRLGQDDGGSLTLAGDLDRWAAPDHDPDRADLHAKLAAHGWSVALNDPTLSVAGRLDGDLRVERLAGKLGSTGDLRVNDLALAGTRLAGDDFRPGPVTLAWDVRPDGSGWAVRRLALDSALASVAVEGGGTGPLPSSLTATARSIRRASGHVDLAALARQLPHLLAPPAGWAVESGRATFDAQPSGPDGDAWRVDARLADLDGRDAQGQRWESANSGNLLADLVVGADALSLRSLEVRTGFGTVSARGEVADRPEGRRFALDGTIVPDSAALSAWLRDHVEPGASLLGHAETFRVAGRWSGPDLFGSLDAGLDVRLDGLDVAGMHLGPTALAARLAGGKLAIDPVRATLNEGTVALTPTVDLAGPGGPTLRLGPDSAIRDARINAEVSRRVLAFVAPVLEGTAEASGRVSVSLNSAAIPLGAGRARGAQVDGSVVFDDVAFSPGPLADALLSALNRPGAPLKLDRPVTLTVRDGRVIQDLSLPIGQLTRVELAGSVDFDRNLDLTATLPVTPAMLGNNPLLANIAAGTAVRLPIRGTLNRPEVDRDAFAANLKGLGQSLLTRGATVGALELLRRAAQRRAANAAPNADPNPGDPAADATAPKPDSKPKPTAEERRAERQERRAERKARRIGGPDPQ